MTKRKRFGTSEQSQSGGDTNNSTSGKTPTFEVIMTNASTYPIIGGLWNSLFDEGHPFSVEELREVLSTALTIVIDLNKYAHEWESPADFPEIIRTWFSRQREILFKGMLIDGPGDILPVYQQLCATAEDSLEGNPSLAEMIYSLIKNQTKIVQDLPISKVDDLIYYRFKPSDLLKLFASTVSSHCLQTERQGGQLCSPATMCLDIGGANRTCVKENSIVEFRKIRLFHMFRTPGYMGMVGIYVGISAKSGATTYETPETPKKNSVNLLKAGVSIAKKAPD